MNLLDDKDGPTSPAEDPAGDPVREAEILTSPAQVILDVRREIEAFKSGGARKELVEALRDQFVATRHQAATKAEAARILALNILQARLPEIKSTAELLRTISVLSAASENDLAVVLDAVPGSGALINVQQSIGLGGSGHRPALPERENGTSNPVNDASHALESFEHLLKYIKNSTSVIESVEEKANERDNLIPWRRSRS